MLQAHRSFCNSVAGHMNFKARETTHQVYPFNLLLRGLQSHWITGCNAQGAQRIQDDGDVDHFLKQRSFNWRQVSESRRDHADQGQSDSGDNAFNSDAPRAAGDLDGRPEAQRLQLPQTQRHHGHPWPRPHLPPPVPAHR